MKFHSCVYPDFVCRSRVTVTLYGLFSSELDQSIVELAGTPHLLLLFFCEGRERRRKRNSSSTTQIEMKKFHGKMKTKLNTDENKKSITSAAHSQDRYIVYAAHVVYVQYNIVQYPRRGSCCCCCVDLVISLTKILNITRSAL